jgi:hypothetical protein
MVILKSNPLHLTTNNILLTYYVDTVNKSCNKILYETSVQESIVKDQMQAGNTIEEIKNIFRTIYRNISLFKKCCYLNLEFSSIFTVIN